MASDKAHVAFIQIAVAAGTQGESELYALDSLGEVWFHGAMPSDHKAIGGDVRYGWQRVLDGETWNERMKKGATDAQARD